ncbi:MAG TPA: DEAD/DEAH box helicase [Rhabdochlamydiaceae bacterium]|nr:DEAD/DEAH box helicase [Rhabdochlamydiaceae bacterium]HSX38871.1 DEAD/DEAH box helicase [Chlamydiales bacterium]
MSLEIAQDVSVELSLSPEGRVYVNKDRQSDERLFLAECTKIEELFVKSVPYAILHLGLRDFASLPPSFLFWQTFSRQFIIRVCQLQSTENQGKIIIDKPSNNELRALLDEAPFMQGTEYLSEEVLIDIWRQMVEILNQELTAFSGSLQTYLGQYSSRWNQVGRVCFHLAENKNNEKKPFAFLATYTQLSHHGNLPQHLPLKRALQESAKDATRSALLSLLIPVQKAAAQSSFVKGLVDAGTIFEAVAWTTHDAHRFLQDIPLMEASGVMIRVPNWWNPQKPPKLKAEVHLGERPASVLGLGSLLEFDIRLAHANGESLTRDEWLELMQGDGGLVKVKGQWVEVDKEKLKALLSHWDHLKQTKREGLSMAEGLRLLAGMDTTPLSEGKTEETSIEWFQVTAGNWLKTVLEQLKNPHRSQEKALEEALGKNLRGELRPYQKKGVQWLWVLYQLRLGGCLADDMGLGKTIQVLSLLLAIKEMGATDKPHLLVVPASLLGNWLAEAARFAPTLKVALAHSSAKERVEGVDLVLTTYGVLQREKTLQETEWNLVILDEAQSIKNPNAKQTLAVKGLMSDVRLALTGTPVENRVGDLWSLFDFTSPGLLGSAKAFAGYSKQAERAHFMGALRKLTQPYILRRLKSDKNIISDLPAKTEMKTYCYLSKAQIRLYRQAIEELAKQLEEAEGIQRRGLVLSSLMRLKQICNHPSQWLGFGEFAEEESGKWIRLREICEQIAEKQEKVLIFTQFKEIIKPLFLFLTNLFGKEGLILHGDIAVSKRAALVEKFQQDQGPPFFILSLKAGGTGLNLTKASHVIHFDRWWNPAVENQATDRAYRIGQKHPVLVHQFICQGTIEEKIDTLIEAKKNLSKELLEEGKEISLTELSNEQVLQMVSLDIRRAMGEE